MSSAAELLANLTSQQAGRLIAHIEKMRAISPLFNVTASDSSRRLERRDEEYYHHRRRASGMLSSRLRALD